MLANAQKTSEISVKSDFFSKSDVKRMGDILRERHKEHAYATARHFMNEHIAIGDKAHASAWARVAQYIFETTEIR